MDFSPEEFEEILNIYGAECDEIIQRMNSYVLLLEKDSSNSDIINKLFRDAHSLKGASRMVGFDKIQMIAHKLEDLLDLANNEKMVLSTEIISVFYKALDCLGNVIQASVEQKRECITEDVDANLKLLQDIINSTDPIESSKGKIEDKSTVSTTDKIVSEEEKAEFLPQDIDEIYTILDQISEFLKKYNAETNNILDDLLKKYEQLVQYFNQKFCRKLKNMVVEAIEKLKFVKAATGILVDFEVDELVQNIEKIRNELAKLITINVDVEPIIESSKNSYKDLVGQLVQLIGGLETEPNNIKEINKTLQMILDYTKDSALQKVYVEIKKIFDNFQNNSVLPSNEILKLVIECVSDGVNFFDGTEATSVDIESIMQRLSIASQVIDLKKDEDSASIEIVPPTEIKEDKLVKTKEFFTAFENVSIKTLRVDTTKLDKLVNQMSELIVSRIKIQDHLKELQNVKHNIEELVDAQNRIMRLGEISKSYGISAENTSVTNQQNSQNQFNNIKNEFEKIYESFLFDCQYYNQSIDELAEMIKNIRVLPIATIFHQFPRMVRDIAVEKNKEIELLISGAETTVDKKIIEEIKSPLVHIIRNSIDHGIEPPEERIRVGKPATGKIILSAKNLSNKVVIEIKDDGRGVNVEKIKMKALSAGLLSENEIKQLNDEQIMNLIFLPGFSTGDKVTELSGRGIGLDVVQSKITQLEGKVSIRSEIGKGATLRIELPLSLATIQAFVVQAEDLFFAIPILAVSVIKIISPNEIFIKDNEKNIIYDNRTIKVYDLAELLNLRKADSNNAKEKLQIFILEVDNEKIGLIVDGIEGDFEILQKKFAPPIFKLRFVSGITALTSGRICYILNISDLMKYSLNDSTKKLMDSRERVKRLNKITGQKRKRFLIYDNTEQANKLNSGLSDFLKEYDFTNDLEEVIKLVNKTEFSVLAFIINKEYENILKLLYEFKFNELYSSSKIVLICQGAEKALQTAFYDLHLNICEFVEQIDPDFCLYELKKISNK